MPQTWERYFQWTTSCGLLRKFLLTARS